MSKEKKKFRCPTLAVTLSTGDRRYEFTVAIPTTVSKRQARRLLATNMAGEKFELDDLGPPLMQLLHKLGHACQDPETDSLQWIVDLQQRRTLADLVLANGEVDGDPDEDEDEYEDDVDEDDDDIGGEAAVVDQVTQN